MKPTLFVITFLLSQVLHAAPYYRFWRGDKLPALTLLDFQIGLNDLFIPKTVEQGKGKGLRSYQPVLLSDSKPKGLPDEIALVAYASKAAYLKLRNSPEGQAYGRLHWDYFDKNNSKSLVPDRYRGELQTNHAYDVLNSAAEWQKGISHVRIHTRDKRRTPSQFHRGFNKMVQSVRAQFPSRGLKSYLVLVSDDYVIQFLLWKDEASRQKVWSSKVGQHVSRLLGLVSQSHLDTATPINKTQLGFGEGGKPQF